MILYAPAPTGFPKDEESFIAGFFNQTPCGTFVDIGAHVGIYGSNTRALWKKGWSGVLIEPDPQSFLALEKLYPDRQRLKLLNVAVTREDGTAQFAQHSDPNYTGWHSLDPKWIETWPKGTANYILVKTRSMTSLLKDGTIPRDLDFLSVDTEGYDHLIIESMPQDFRPRLIVVEVDKRLVREKMDAEMEARNYRFCWGNYLNSIYERP